MEWYTILAIALAVIALLIPLAFIWFICIGGICMDIKRRRAASSKLVCSTDADCPPGYTCTNGRCLSQNTL